MVFDQDFYLFRRMCSHNGGKETAKQIAQYLAFPCGLVRGALAALGVQSVVTADISAYPQCNSLINPRLISNKTVNDGNGQKELNKWKHENVKT